jgi:benzoyl-CoA reductase/2-hydroxyglutaryl-CoA dehydratase subunit BcrC/BadD/HgdB
MGKKRVHDEGVFAMNETEQSKFVGFTCAYTPLPLIHAAGFVPYRLFPVGAWPDQAGQMLHDNLCPHIKRVLDRALADDIPHLAGVVFMNSCDAMRRLYDGWQVARPNDRSILIDLPPTKDDKASNYFAKEFTRLIDTLSEWSGRSLTEESIRASVQIVNQLALQLSQLRARNATGTLRGGAKRLQEMYLQAATQPFEKSIDEIKTIALDDKTTQSNGGVPVYVFGNVLADPDFFALVESCGAHVVGEDLCTGSRMFSVIEDDGSRNVISRLAKGILNRPACARTMETHVPGAMAREVLAHARACNARGVIAHTMKFCDPYLARMPAVREALGTESLPFLLLEGDCTARSLGQQKTRIEAFIEMLR